ncbi:DUF4371 domain-containing protein [Trichonephila clavipes]|nr:DUF4371 domain-containing protein [Trichonephila clavipes]
MARYFFLIIDSTPDSSYTDQLASALQCVSVRKACVNECLIRVLLGVSNKDLGMVEATLNLLKELNLDFKNFRVQSYDNVSNMPEVYSGLQSIIQKQDVFAEFVPSAALTLNFAGEKACIEAIVYKDFTVFCRHLLTDRMC